MKLNQENNNQRKPFLDPTNQGIFVITSILVIGAIGLVELSTPSPVVAKSIWVVFFVILNPIGIKIGDILRKIAAPDMFISTGMTDTLKTKFFWSYGPQLLGSFGAFIVSSLPSNVLFY